MQFSINEGNAAALATDIGGYPAIRRSYRKWLSEMLEWDTARADAFVLSCFSDASLPAYFRDDTLVSTLLSPSAAGFLARQSDTLLTDQGRLLLRVIHLLRVACKAPQRWFVSSTSVPSQLLVPKGEAWPAMLKIVSEGLEQLLPTNLVLLLGLLEDWARSVEWNVPDPAGFHEAGKVAFALLSHLDHYRMDDLRKRVLIVITKIPRANNAAFQDLIERGCALGRHDRTASDFVEILLPGFNGFFACRDFPEHMVRLITAHSCLSDHGRNRARDYHSHSDIGPFFGIREHVSSDFFPASAIRGPFLPLLQTHPKIGLKAIIDLLNHAASWYGEQRWPYNRLEPAWQITLDVPGEGQVTQWASPRLWCLYRGLSVGPDVLQTALMALESWLLEICKIEGFDPEPWLLKLLKESNNVAITAVVAGVCNAYPEKGGRAALALFSSQDLIEMDRARMVQDRAPNITGLLPTHNAETELYEEERKNSGALSHRRLDLEALAVKLQLGTQREGVWKILDGHRASLPPVEEQSDKHRLWRLALHRMDVRGFRPLEPQPGSEAGSSETQDAATLKPPAVYYGPGVIETDVQAIVDRHAPVRARQEADLGLLFWGRSAWERDQSKGVDITTWQTRLNEAQERDNELPEADDFARGGPAFVAAVCVRDHWKELRSEDRECCITKLIDEIERDCDSDDDTVRHARGLMRPDRAAAYVLPWVLSHTPLAGSEPRLREALAKALTHSVSEVVAYAAEGVGYYLQGDSQDFAMRCVGALARQARLIADHQAKEKAKPFRQRRLGGALMQSVIPEVRACVARGDLDAEDELTKLNLHGWPGRLTARTILRILGYHPQETSARAFHKRVLEFLVDGWVIERRQRDLRDRDYEFEHESFERVARFVLKLHGSEALMICEPLLAAVGDHSREVARFIESLVVAEDYSDGDTPFWQIWQAFADQLSGASWVEDLDSRYGTGIELLGKIFFGGLSWKKGVHHWRRLEGQASRIDALVNCLPVSAAVLHAYCRFLYDIGERSLPNGFVVVAERFGDGKMSEMLAAESTGFYLESLLRKYVYGEPLKLKQNSRVRSAVLRILDHLVEAGSSAAFRMRDDFVTPVRSP